MYSFGFDSWVALFFVWQQRLGEAGAILVRPGQGLFLLGVRSERDGKRDDIQFDVSHAAYLGPPQR